MKTFKIFSVLALVLIAGLGLVAFKTASHQATPMVVKDKGFAVVELFTSEGCSSCPAADGVIAKLEKEMVNKPVYILAYHVDYWNRLGWKDVFSSADYSRRQNTYAGWLNLNSVYTPQVIVNGRTEFVGSQEETLRNSINQSLKHAVQTELTITGMKVKANSVLLTYKTGMPERGSRLLLALIQKTATTVVKAGENSGRTLSHVQIVSNLQDISLTAASGEASLKLPANFFSANFEVIAFVQNTQTGEINAATRMAF